MLIAPSNAFCRIVGTLSGGWAISNEDWDSTTLQNINQIHYQYIASKSHQSNGLWSLFVGSESYLSEAVAMQLGLSYFSSSYFSVQGILTQGRENEFGQQYDFHYRIRSQQLLFDSKWLYFCSENVHPYLSAGIGVGFNQAAGYQADIPPGTVLTPQFANQNRTSFAYGVGFGIDVDFNKRIRAGIGYRFFDFGKAELGNGPIGMVPNSQTLSQSHMYQNIFLAQLSWVC